MVSVGGGVQQPGGQLDDRGEVPVLVNAGRVLAEHVAQQPVVGDGADEHGRQRRQSRVGAVGPAWVVSQWLTTR